MRAGISGGREALASGMRLCGGGIGCENGENGLERKDFSL